MSKWFYKISSTNGLANLLDCIEYFETQFEEARKEVQMAGSLEKMSASMPGITEYRYSQLQELESILEHLNILYKQVRGNKFREYSDHYDKALSSRDAMMYAEADSEVINYSTLINQIAFVRNKFLGIMKGLENKSYQINNVVKLRAAGLEDVELNNIYVPNY